LSGVFGCQDLFWIDKRKTTPLKMPWKERFKLIFQVLPCWVFRNMAFQGFYSSTSHMAFGEKTGALPSGRFAGRPLATGLGAANGCDRKGPTALLNSVAAIDASLAANGYTLNLRFDWARAKAFDIL
jgi:hypothetical protein